MLFFFGGVGQGIKKYVCSGEGGNSKAYKSIQGEGGGAKMTILERPYFLNGPQKGLAGFPNLDSFSDIDTIIQLQRMMLIFTHRLHQLTRFPDYQNIQAVSPFILTAKVMTNGLKKIRILIIRLEMFFIVLTMKVKMFRQNTYIS